MASARCQTTVFKQLSSNNLNYVEQLEQHFFLAFAHYFKLQINLIISEG